MIHAIVLSCTDVSSLAWCGSCKHFRACRPPLRVLVIGWQGDLDIRESHPELRHHMAVHVSAAEGAGSHRSIDGLPAALAAEVTHLFVVAWRDSGLDLAPERLPSYGAKYSALRCLALAHLTRGSPHPLRPTPAACAKQLICATAATLRSLSIDAPNGFEAGDAVDVMVSTQLHALSLLLVPSFLPAALKEELPQGYAHGGRLQAGEAERPSGEVPVHLLDEEEVLYLLWLLPTNGAAYHGSTYYGLYLPWLYLPTMALPTMALPTMAPLCMALVVLIIALVTVALATMARCDEKVLESSCAPMPRRLQPHAPRLQLPCISHAPPMHLPCTSHASPTHLQVFEFLRWRRDHEVMEEAQGAGYAMETDYLRNCVAARAKWALASVPLDGDSAAADPRDFSDGMGRFYTQEPRRWPPRGPT